MDIFKQLLSFRLQVEGGFVQGMGWTCLEELVWGDEDHKWLPPGVLHTRGPGQHLLFLGRHCCSYLACFVFCI